jgi:hypothetical protein
MFKGVLAAGPFVSSLSHPFHTSLLILFFSYTALIYTSESRILGKPNRMLENVKRDDETVVETDIGHGFTFISFWIVHALFLGFRFALQFMLDSSSRFESLPAARDLLLTAALFH